MAKTMADAPVTPDEPRLVDNPFRRESHRPWYARRGPRWFVGLAILALLALNAFAFKKVGQRADPITVDTAVARFRTAAASVPPGAPPASAGGGAAAPAPAPGVPAPRGDAGTAIGPQDEAAATETASAPRGAIPEPGVYVYDTDGFEKVSALGGAEHQYPKQTTITVTSTECGMDARWSPLEQRFEDWHMCTDGTGIAMAAFTTHHEFFGQTEERKYACDGVYVRPVSDAPGFVAHGACSSKSDQARATSTVIGHESVEVQGTAVDAVHVQFDHVVSGSATGTQKGDIWVRASDGLVLRYITVIDGDADSVIGPTHFNEEVNLRLAELAPRR